MASQLWGPKTVVIVFALAGGLVGADIALWPWDGQISILYSVITGLLTGGFAGGFIAWFIGQMDELGPTRS